MTNATETRTDIWLKWSWQHYALIAEEFDSYDDAIRAAVAMSNAGEESLSCIEGPLGRVDAAAVQRDMDAVEDEQAKAYQSGPRATHAVKLIAPDGEGEAWYESFTSLSEAEEAAGRLRSQLGDRVIVKALPG